MKKAIIFLTVVITMILGLFACSSDKAKLSNELLDKVLDDGSVLIVDVREPEEYEDGHIEGSLNIPLGSVAGSLKVYSGYEELVLVCRSGNRSGRAIEILKKHGITNTINGGGWDSFEELLNTRKEERN